MKWSRTKDELKEKFITSKINQPDKTLKEIQEETWVNYETARKIIKEDLPEVVKSSETIANLIDVNNRILNITWELLLTKLENWEKVRIDEVIKSRDLALKQNKLVEVIDNKEWEFIVKFEI